MLFEAITHSQYKILSTFYKIHIKLDEYWVCTLKNALCGIIIILVTSFIDFLLDATTGLQLYVLLQILVIFTLIFHLRSVMIGGNRGILNLKIYAVSLLFNFRFYECTFKTNKHYVCRYKI